MIQALRKFLGIITGSRIRRLELVEFIHECHRWDEIDREAQKKVLEAVSHEEVQAARTHKQYCDMNRAFYGCSWMGKPLAAP
jgi:hypothetical protein